MSERALVLSEDQQEELTVRMHEKGYFDIHENPDDFIPLKSGRLSPHYFNVRPGIGDPNFLNFFSNNLVYIARTLRDGETKPDRIVAQPEAMTTYGGAIGVEYGVGVAQPRVDTKKASGNKTPILGEYQEGMEADIFDDVVTDGDTKIKGIELLRAHGFKIGNYIVGLDREEGGAPQVEESTGVIIQPALAVTGVVNMLHHLGRISDTKRDNVAQYLEQYGERQL